MRIVLDTNVFVSGIFWQGAPYRILKAWQQHKVTLVITEEIFEEYNRVAHLLSKKYSPKNIGIDPFLQLVAIYGEFYSPIILNKSISRDSDDDKFFACAIAAGSRIIVSGDRDLLDVNSYLEVQVIAPSEFIKIHHL